MILEQLVLHNFGIYRGRQEIDLALTSKSRPIVLFGGLNGSGKTTLLDALKLVLYGKLADCSSRRGQSYEDFLRRCINRSVDPGEGAAIELRFRHRVDGQEHVFRVHRSWTAPGRTVRDRVEVLKDETLDPVLTENWAEQVEEFIPARLSPFFFFDGEQIESLADLERSAGVLETALQSLLGLDLVDQLQTDLKVLERRYQDKQRSRKELEELEAAKAEAAEVDARYSNAVSGKASKVNQVERQEKKVRELEEQFRQAGGELYTRRAALEAEKRTVESKLQHARDRLRKLAESAVPLLLVKGLLEEASIRSSSPETRLKQELFAILLERDVQLLAEAERVGAPRRTLEQLERYLLQDRERRKPARSEGPQIQLKEEAARDLATLRSTGLAEVQATTSLLLQEIKALSKELEKAERGLAMVPDEEAVGGLSRKLDKARKDLAKAQAELEVAEEELKRLQLERTRKWEAYAKKMELDADVQFRQEEAGRIVQHAQGVREVMAQFRAKVMQRHLQRIEQLILESFRRLLRKESLVSRLTIEPSSYRMWLFGPDDKLLPPESLSAGERQILAVSTIWGLARAAGRPIPVVIDTPLGRLDSVHRRLMVESYFPAASHQVLLLSTDEEIDEAGFERLKSSVGRKYRLVYDEHERATHVEPGYFW